MSDDITFCFSKCSIVSCERNKKNIKIPWRDHSFAELEGTAYCKKRRSVKHDTN